MNDSEDVLAALWPPDLRSIVYMSWHCVSRTFAPMWDVFRVSSDKLALCHLELMRKMNDLIREINKYGDEQVKIHRRVGARAYGGPRALAVLCLDTL